MVGLSDILGAMRTAVRLLCEVLQSHQTVIGFFGQTQHVVSLKGSRHLKIVETQTISVLHKCTSTSTCIATTPDQSFHHEFTTASPRIYTTKTIQIAVDKAAGDGQNPYHSR